MTDRFLVVATFAALLGSGLIAGAFYAFSTFVMKALIRLPAAAGMSCMQSINIAVINPMFLGVFLGTAVICFLTGAAALLHWNTPGVAYLLTGGALYLFGTFLVTMLFNVPLNNALARLTPAHPDMAVEWAGYVRRWTAWNHVRTTSALAAMVCFGMALCA